MMQPMKKKPLKESIILVTNDDGIHAEGLAVLVRVAEQLAGRVVVCAPEVEQSAASHSLTIHRPLRLRKVAVDRYSVDGTPTDCVLLAINHVFRNEKPDLVLSGINMGANVADDVTYSGTIAAAMEATLLGVPAIALSQDIPDGTAAKWQVAEAEAVQLIQRLYQVGWERNVLININFPACEHQQFSGVSVVRHGRHKQGDDLIERFDPRGRSYFWIGPLRGEMENAADTDIAVLANHGIAVTPLCLDLNFPPALKRLEDGLAA
ncbi:MAG: 5'/3'-nucleotidase SurE [Alphaproteobacteria bacterium]